jgi:hypothetical protein
MFANQLSSEEDEEARENIKEVITHPLILITSNIRLISCKE